MRQIFSVRFFAAVGAVVGLFALLAAIFGSPDAADDAPRAEAAATHRIDLVAQVFAARGPGFGIDEDGNAMAELTLILDQTRMLRILPGTPGESLCPAFPAIGTCAIVADLLGEAVVWFALVPMGSNNTVDMPAIDTLDDGLATLVNGWQVPYAPVLDRRCEDEFASYAEFRRELDDDFSASFSIEQRRLTAVECRVRVPYAPPPTTQPVFGADGALLDDLLGGSGSTATTSTIATATTAVP